VGAAAAELNYRVALRGSRLAVGFILASGFATMLLVVAMPLAVSAKVAAVAWAGANTLVAVRIVCQPCEFALHGELIDVLRRARRLSGVLRAGSFVSPWLVIVRWRPAGARFDRTVTVLPGMLGAEDFRRLRVYLRCRTTR
jgi:hypothetical protein